MDIAQTKSTRYKKLRPLIFWVLLLAGFAVVGLLLYKELTTPLRTPDVTGIVSTPPSKVDPPAASEKSTHSVPPGYPKHLVISKLGIDANIHTVGITKEGTIDAPKTAWDVGWYQNGTLPGSGHGAALLDGHVNDAFNTPGVFSGLISLVAGDEITIVKGDDSQLAYRVIKVEQAPLKNIDMKKLLSSADPGKEGLTLVTCGGHYDKTSATYSDRVVVFALRV